jgi:hypothetical protein
MKVKFPLPAFFQIVISKICLFLLLPCLLQSQDFHKNVNLIRRDALKDSVVKGLRKPATVMKISSDVKREVLGKRPDSLLFEIPVDGKWVQLSLHKTNLFSDDAVIVESQGKGRLKVIQEVGTVHYRGTVRGEKSLVSISFFEDEVIGIIDRPGGTWNLGHLRDQVDNNEQHYLFNADDIEQKQAFNCYTDDEIAGTAASMLNNPEQNGVTVGQPVDLYIETDYRCFVNNQYNSTKVTKWVAGLLNMVSALYENESIKVQVKTLKIWTDTDPYVSATNTSDALDLFSAEMAGGFAGDMAHLLSQRSLGGGIAWINVLCGNANRRTAVSASLRNYYTPSEDYSWSINVIAHELGHNLGSPHTHKCDFWAGGTAIDRCGPTWDPAYAEGNCTGPLPTVTGGTIMSYCHGVTGVGIRFANGFGPQPGNLIRSKVQAAACLSNCANLKVELDTSFATCSTLGTASVTATGGVAPITYSWSTGETTSSISGLARGDYYVTVKSATAGCQVIQGFTIGELMGNCPTVTSFSPISALQGDTITLFGSRFTAATGVSFGGLPAKSFKIVHSSRIDAVVNAGNSGNITVTNASGSGVVPNFVYCSSGNSFTNPILLRTISTNFDTVGNNFISECYTNRYRTNSSPGSANANSAVDVFYKFKTGPCVFTLSVGVCLPAAGYCSLFLLDSAGNVLLATGSALPAGCTSGYGATFSNMNVKPFATYVLVVEGNNADAQFPWTLSFKPGTCTPPVISSVVPNSGAKDSSIVLNGNYFTNATTVHFNGVPAASFVVNSATKITAVVPEGAAAGRIAVRTPMGLGYSSSNFNINRNTSSTGQFKLCPGGGTTLTAATTGGSYQWQLSTGEGYKNITNNSNYTGATTRNLTITNAPTNWFGYTYRCLVDGMWGGYPAYLQFANTFLGTVSTAWENAANWGCVGQTADANTDVLVFSGNPILSTSTYARSITVQPDITVTTKPGVKIGLGFIYQNVPANKLYGGNQNENAASIIPMGDGGWVLAGSSNSSYNGNVDQMNNGGYDCWIVRMDGAGRILWNKLLGGNGDDKSVNIKSTADGGFILAATSNSLVIDGKTNNGGTDVWVAKLSKDGNVEWSRIYGGSSTDEPAEIFQTSDGGYILAANSFSPISGNVSGENHGSCDFWVVKLNSNGSIAWEKLYGGDLEDRCKGIVENEGGYIVAGHTYSSANGDVTMVNKGSRDYWYFRIDLDGNLIWSKSIGGNGIDELESIALTSDGGFVLAGLSSSSANGDVTNASKGSTDYWIVKCDIDGVKVWDKLYGGSLAERATCVRQTADGGYIITGFSGSSNTGNVTGAIVGASTYDYWTIKLNGSGALVWNKLSGGNNYDQPYAVCETVDGNFVVAGHTSSSNSGQLAGVISNGLTDCWLFKLNSSGQVSW